MGLTDLPKSERACALPPPPGSAIPVKYVVSSSFVLKINFQFELIKLKGISLFLNQNHHKQNYFKKCVIKDILNFNVRFFTTQLESLPYEQPEKD